MTVYPGSPFYFDIENGKYGPGRLVKKEERERTPFQDAFQLGFEGVLTRERMEELVRTATRHFYLRPRNMLRIIADLRSFSHLRHTVLTAWSTLRWLINKPARQSD